MYDIKSLLLHRYSDLDIDLEISGKLIYVASEAVREHEKALLLKVFDYHNRLKQLKQMNNPVPGRKSINTCKPKCSLNQKQLHKCKPNKFVGRNDSKASQYWKNTPFKTALVCSLYQKLLCKFVFEVFKYYCSLRGGRRRAVDIACEFRQKLYLRMCFQALLKHKNEGVKILNAAIEKSSNHYFRKYALYALNKWNYQCHWRSLCSGLQNRVSCMQRNKSLGSALAVWRSYCTVKMKFNRLKSIELYLRKHFLVVKAFSAWILSFLRSRLSKTALLERIQAANLPNKRDHVYKINKTLKMLRACMITALHEVNSNCLSVLLNNKKFDYRVTKKSMIPTTVYSIFQSSIKKKPVNIPKFVKNKNVSRSNASAEPIYLPKGKVNISVKNIDDSLYWDIPSCSDDMSDIAIDHFDKDNFSDLGMLNDLSDCEEDDWDTLSQEMRESYLKGDSFVSSLQNRQNYRDLTLQGVSLCENALNVSKLHYSQKKNVYYEANTGVEILHAGRLVNKCREALQTLNWYAKLNIAGRLIAMHTKRCRMRKYLHYWIQKENSRRTLRHDFVQRQEMSMKQQIFNWWKICSISRFYPLEIRVSRLRSEWSTRHALYCWYNHFKIERLGPQMLKLANKYRMARFMKVWRTSFFVILRGKLLQLRNLKKIVGDATKLWSRKWRTRFLLKKVFGYMLEVVIYKYFRPSLTISDEFHLLSNILSAWRSFATTEKTSRLSVALDLRANSFRRISLLVGNFVMWKYRVNAMKSFKNTVFMARLRFLRFWFHQFHARGKAVEAEMNCKARRFYRMYLSRKIFKLWKAVAKYFCKIIPNRRFRSKLLRKHFVTWRNLYCLVDSAKQLCALTNYRRIAYSFRFWCRLMLWKSRYYDGLTIVRKLIRRRLLSDAWRSLKMGNVMIKSGSTSRMRGFRVLNEHQHSSSQYVAATVIDEVKALQANLTSLELHLANAEGESKILNEGLKISEEIPKILAEKQSLSSTNSKKNILDKIPVLNLNERTKRVESHSTLEQTAKAKNKRSDKKETQIASKSQGVVKFRVESELKPKINISMPASNMPESSNVKLREDLKFIKDVSNIETQSDCREEQSKGNENIDGSTDNISKKSLSSDKHNDLSSSHFNNDNIGMKDDMCCEESISTEVSNGKHVTFSDTAEVAIISNPSSPITVPEVSTPALVPLAPTVLNSKKPAKRASDQKQTSAQPPKEQLVQKHRTTRSSNNCVPVKDVKTTLHFRLRMEAVKTVRQPLSARMIRYGYLPSGDELLYTEICDYLRKSLRAWFKFCRKEKHGRMAARFLITKTFQRAMRRALVAWMSVCAETARRTLTWSFGACNFNITYWHKQECKTGENPDRIVLPIV